MHLVMRGHFRSRDEDGDHTVWSATVWNSMLHANFMALWLIEPELLPIEVIHCGNRNFRPIWLGLWPDDLHIRTWPVFLEDIPDVRKWTFTSTLSKVIY